MKKFLKILAIVLAVIVVVIAGFAIWQWDNIKATYVALTSNPEEIVAQIEATRQEQEKTMKEYNVTVQSLDATMTGELLDGKMSADEAKAALGITQELLDQARKETDDEKKDTLDKKSILDDLINKCAAELFSYEIELMARLGEMKKEALAEWSAIPKEDRTKDKLIGIGLRGLEKCYDIEVEADKNVKAVLSRYREKLKKHGIDDKPLDDIWKYYCEKKANQKAYYINKYIN